jgi:dTMP kinase
MAPGKFFVIEGSDGAGKTTVLNKLREMYPGFAFTREPGGSPLGERLRTLLFDPVTAATTPETKLLLFFASRAENVSQIIDWRKAGMNVVSDRFDSSTYAFQVAPFSDSGRDDLLETLFCSLRSHIVERPLAEPSAYIFLDLPVEEARRRKAAAEGEQTYFDVGTETEYEDRKHGFERFAERYARPTGLWHVVDATRSREEVFQDVDAIIRRLIAE